MSFTFQDPIANRFLAYVPDSLRIDRTIFPEGRTIRLLTGTLDFTGTHDNFSVQQRLNVTNSLGIVNASVTSGTLKSCISPIKQKDLDAYLTNAAHTNKKFHENLLTEYCYLFYHHARGNHTTAFAHLYRSLELISYSFPLMHASMSRNYYKTYDSIRSYFKGGEDGELKFFRSFTNKLFEGDPILSTTADFNIIASNADLQSRIYKTFKRLYQGDTVIQFDDTLKKFTIPYSRLIDAIITLRNRYFHFATGGYQENISSHEMGHPDSFFGCFNVQAVTWLSMIYFEMLKTLCADE